MGKSYISLKMNGMNIKKAYNKLINSKVNESSELKYFNKLPEFSQIEDIMLGADGTMQSILKLKNNGFVVLDKTINPKIFIKSD